MTTLANIRTKVRRLTATPSTAQLTDTQIDDYVNTFYLYDFPASAKVEQFIVNQSIYLEAGVDAYDFEPNDNIVLQSPVYVAGQSCMISYSQEEFYRWWPKVDYIEQFDSDGSVQYSLTMTNTPIQRGSFFIAGLTGSNVQLNVVDDGDGNLTGDIAAGTNTIDYDTGAVDVTFSAAIAVATLGLTASYYPYTSGQPTSVLLFNDTITVRPIPDKPYELVMQVQRKPTALLASGASPTLEEWWQLLAVGAAKKILEDRLAMDQVAMIMPLYKQQISLVLSRTASQYAQQRTSTIYTDQINYPYVNYGSYF